MLQLRYMVGNQMQFEGNMAESSSSSPGQPPAASSPETPPALPIVVKKYANRRLYNTETSSYITLDNLAEMIRAGRDFVVYDAKSIDDITRGVLTQIIVEEESKGSAMLPTAFLRQLIGFYGGNLQGVVPRYLEHAMSSFARQQQQVRQMMERTLSPFLPTGVEEMSRQNMAIFERAISMWNPFHRNELAEGEAKPEAPALAQAEQDELERLRREVESLKQQPAPASLAPEEQAELERLRHEVESLKQQPAPAVLTAPEQAELERLRQEVESLKQQPAPASIAPQEQRELERLRHEVESLEQQLAAAHAMAVVPESQTAIVPPEAPANVLADPASASNGAIKPGRRAGPRGKVSPPLAPS